MKIRLVLIVNFIAFLLLSQIYLAISSNQIDDRGTYSVLFARKNYEIRKYNSMTLETINSKAYRFKEYSKKGITNTEKLSLSDIHEAKMSNLSGSLVSQNRSKRRISKPENLAITQGEVYLAVITFNGFAFEKDIKTYAQTMALALKKSNIRHFGNFHFVSYNSHFQFFKRRNGVLVHVNYYKK
jgi:hypothetical protein